ncbi:hypothetical protein QJQ45_024647 [Haematococcus lacustris]|nr:hypothetical protein QJQ45_024647 [Haematococcus lacustris]
MAKKKRKGSDKKQKGADCELREITRRSCSQRLKAPQDKQRQERRDGSTTRRRQVIKVPEGAVLRGCKKTRRKLREHLRLRAEIHSQLRVIASLLVLRIFLTCLVGNPTPGFPSAPQPPAVQPPQPPDAPPYPSYPQSAPAQSAPAQSAPAQPASMECDTNSDSESDCDSEPEPQSDSESEPELEPVTQPPLRRCSARLAALAPAAPTGPPLPLDCEHPVMLRQLKDFCKFFANPNFKTCYNQLQRRLVRKGQRRHPMLMPVFEDPSNQALLAKLQDLGSINLGSIISLQLLTAVTAPTSDPDETDGAVNFVLRYMCNHCQDNLAGSNKDRLKRHLLRCSKFLASTQAMNIAKTFSEIAAAIEEYKQENKEVAELQQDAGTTSGCPQHGVVELMVPVAQLLTAIQADHANLADVHYGLAIVDKWFGDATSKRMDYGHHVALYLAAVLDPRYRHKPHNLTVEEVLAAEELAAKLASADGKGKDAAGNAARLELLDTWLEPDYAVGMGLTMDIVAQRVLSIPATSAATERLFSAFKFIWSDRRSRLLLGRMWIMSYVFFNTRVMTRKEHHASAETQEEWESYMAAQVVLDAPQL